MDSSPLAANVEDSSPLPANVQGSLPWENFILGHVNGFMQIRISPPHRVLHTSRKFF